MFAGVIKKCKFFCSIQSQSYIFVFLDLCGRERHGALVTLERRSQ